jgi:hypothetical protein
VSVSYLKKGKTVPLQAWSGPEGSRNLMFQDFMITAQDGGKVVGFTHWPPLPEGYTPGSHSCWRLSRPQGHSATGRIVTEKSQWHHRESNSWLAGLLFSDLTTTPPRTPYLDIATIKIRVMIISYDRSEPGIVRVMTNVASNVVKGERDKQENCWHRWDC